MKQLIKILAFGMIIPLFIACQKDDVEPTSSTEQQEQQIHQFIEKIMKSIYLWADQIKEVKPDLNQSPKDFFESLRHSEDTWSYIEEDPTTSRSNMDGKERSFGYKVQFYKVADDMVVGMILFVYKNSPAEQAGLKRGDVIVTNNGEFLTTATYPSVVNDETVTLQVGKFNSNAVYVIEKDYHLSKANIEQNPILLDTVLQINQKKVGYLVYSQFYDNQSTHLPQLSQTIRKIKNENIDEFILDLRYNIGGAENAARRLCSLLAPANQLRNEDILIKKQWNSTYQKTINSDLLNTRFDASVLADNLDLQRIYVLTGEQTASASEVLISGLQPYMQQVTIIGVKTRGKYVGMQQVVSTQEKLKKWKLWPVTLSYTNSRGESVKGGIPPTYTVKEYSNYLPPFGHSEDPLLNKALSLISGKQTTQSKSTQIQTNQETQHWQAIGETESILLIGL